MLTVIGFLAGALLPLVLIVATAPPATAVAPTTATASRVPQCPPDCGAVAAGDPLLVPFMTQNPGPDWQAFPATDTQSYVDSLRRNALRLTKGSARTNVAAAQWESVDHQYHLLITLVSSTSLPQVRLQNPVSDAADLCSSAGGVATGSPTPVTGIPNSASGSCAFRPNSSIKGAVVEAFVRANVAVLIEVSSHSKTSIEPLIAVPPAHQQYASLPKEGVPVSSGGIDLGWILFWVLLLAALLVAANLCARRRGSWRGPFVAIKEAFERRKLALLVSLLAVIGAMAFSMLDATIMRGFGEWFGVATFGDFWQNWSDAAYTTFSGGYGHLYVLDHTLETAPAFQVIVAPVARLAFGLPFPDPSAVLYPAAFWVAGPLFLGGMALPICAADRWMNGMGVTDLRRRLVVFAAMGITLPPIALSGHPEGLIALGAMLYGLAAALDGRHRATGWWLGVALAFQPFAFLAIPIAFALLGRRRMLSTLVPMIIVPLAFLVVPLASEPAVTLRQLLHQQVYDVFGYISPTWNLDPGVAAYVRAAVALAAIPAAVVLVRFLPRSRRGGAALVLWTLAALFTLRVFEPELFPYFLAPALAVFPISASRLTWWRLGAACLLAVWLNYWLHVAVRAEWSLWLILVAQLCALAWLSFPGRGRSQLPERAQSEVPPVRRPAKRELATR
ncbi:MAG: hypothetical protein WB565_07515 [Acidimicrobiales bacterium]